MQKDPTNTGEGHCWYILSMTTTPRLDAALAEILEDFHLSYDVSGESEDPNEALRDSAVANIKELFSGEGKFLDVAEAENEFDNVPWGDHD